jgi:hypothetical protein
MDFMTCQGNDAILVVVVDQSKLAKFMPTKATLMIIYMITLFFEMWVTHNNMLEVIMNDYDIKLFESVDEQVKTYVKVEHGLPSPN